MERRTGSERRESPRERVASGGKVAFWIEDKNGSWSRQDGEIGDRSEKGVGLILNLEVEAGQNVMVEGEGFAGGSGGRQKGRICWCRPTVDGRFRAGVTLTAAAKVGAQTGEDFVDYYETMELSASASMETIHRIYRILAQRLHPDNAETGSNEAFRKLAEAYKVLSGPETRAAFDSTRGVRQQVHWRVFDQRSATPSVEQEQSKRRGVLKALYLKRLREPENPGMNMTEMEALLGTPREHLDFTMWFLKEQGWAVRTDNGRYSITVKGVEQAEKQNVWDRQPTEHLQLEPAY
ncbi:MAG: J domain-containing protein [Bryobacteraceae bacterium]